MAATDMLNVFEQSRVSPPAGTIGNQSLPLTFFDIAWLGFPPVHQLFFYEFPHPINHFTQTIVPNLKHSLSITLQHFFPFVGNLILFPCINPSTDKKPEIRHVEGDSVSFSMAQCSLDFNDLTGNHPRNAENFYPLVPRLGCATKASNGSLEIPIFAVQVTLFPNCGISIGLTNQHALCDATTKFDFLKAWTSIARFGGDESFLASQSVPFYGRVIKDAKRFDEIIWSQIGIGLVDKVSQPQQLVGPTNKVRATFVMTREHIKRFKELVAAQRPTLTHVSSFTIVCAYVWCCRAESRVAIGEEKDENGLELFVCSADCRARLDPPVPATYFGNCIAPCIATVKSTVLLGKEAFVTAVELIKEGIHERVNSKEGILKDVELWIPRVWGLKHSKIGGVAGTPKVHIYDTDFGWGKPKKYEIISTDYTGSMSLNVCRESVTDLEIGLCFPDIQMNAFATIFNEGLENLL